MPGLVRSRIIISISLNQPPQSGDEIIYVIAVTATLSNSFYQEYYFRPVFRPAIDIIQRLQQGIRESSNYLNRIKSFVAIQPALDKIKIRPLTTMLPKPIVYDLENLLRYFIHQRTDLRWRWRAEYPDCYRDRAGRGVALVSFSL